MLLSKRLPPIQTLLIFEAAARHLSFTGAARELGSTQSAISQQIKGLEQTLELQLFRRIYRGVELTDDGWHLFKAVQEGFNSMAACLDKLQKSRLHQTINVATDFAFAAYWLLPRLPDFREQHPEIDVRIITSQGQHDIHASDLDVFVALMNNAPNDAPSTRLFYEEVYPICSPAFLEKHGPIQSHKKLASMPLLKLGTDAGQGWQDWNSFFKGRRSLVEPSDPVLTFNNYTLLIQAAIAGQGVGLGWGNLVDELVENKLLVGLKDFTLLSETAYYVVEPKPQEQLLAKQHFIAWLGQHQTDTSL